MLQERKRLEDTLLSRSFLHWGGEIRPISRPVKLQLLTAVIPELDINLLANLTNYEIDQLYFVFFKVVADGKLANVGLTNKPLIAAAELLKKSRQRVSRQYGTGSMMGLDAELTNIDTVAKNMGWNEDRIYLLRSISQIVATV